MKRTVDQRRQARERKARSRALAMEGCARVELVIDVAQQELLISLGLLPGNREVERSEIADAIGVLLRSKLDPVTRDTGDFGNGHHRPHEQCIDQASDRPREADNRRALQRRDSR
ncbi:hypothetical protein [Reyranella sp.]|uniref:hypothetical protein n=1 Tax=Reyranella sp. TaxID=1929291 RepID=UPI003D138F54